MPNIFEYSESGFSAFLARDEHPDPHSFVMHAHRLHEVYCFLSGGGKYHVEGTEYPLSPGDVLLMRSAEAHMLEADPSMTYERLVFYITDDMLGRIDPSGTLASLFVGRALGTGNHFRIGTLDTSSLMRFSQLPSPLLRVRLFAVLLQILADAASAASAVGNGGEGAEIIAYINENLAEELSVDSIAAHFYMSRSQLERVFCASTGSGVWEYVRVKRLMAARELIRSGSPASRAALACGWRDYSSFWRAYKKRFGTGPCR